MSVKCLYTENLNKLGAYHYDASNRTHAYHVKISYQSEIASNLDSYIQGEVDNDFRKKFQLHFIGYNFIVSPTSSSTKIRMTTDSSMHSESG